MEKRCGTRKWFGGLDAHGEVGLCAFPLPQWLLDLRSMRIVYAETGVECQTFEAEEKA